MRGKNVHSFLEKSGLPILIVVLVPIGLILYASWNTIFPNSDSSAPAAGEAQSQTQAAPANLYLDDQSALPTQVAAGDLVPFSFSVQNPGSASADYQYKVSVKWSTGEEDVIDENTLSLQSGASTTIPENLKFEIATETAEVSVQILPGEQLIEFALPRAQ